ncbi:hypothetical protein [Selenomonas sp. TAMA-11512]|uniref:hypothetical protein n=1 Tax=Selenomonas sp. TAMA-11512 TaxID=3095337 RepID=UPI0030CE63EF
MKQRYRSILTAALLLLLISGLAGMFPLLISTASPSLLISGLAGMVVPRLSHDG